MDRSAPFCRYKGVAIYEEAPCSAEGAPELAKRFFCSVYDDELSDELFEGLTEKINDALRKLLT